MAQRWPQIMALAICQIKYLILFDIYFLDTSNTCYLVPEQFIQHLFYFGVSNSHVATI